MSANIELRNNKYSFVENGGKDRQHLAWHKLGQVFDRPMFINEALEACQANYDVELEPVVALTPAIKAQLDAKDDTPIILDPVELRKMLIPGKAATMRTDVNETLGIVGDTYGIVQNRDAFSFIDQFINFRSAHSFFRIHISAFTDNVSNLNIPHLRIVISLLNVSYAGSASLKF